jgi:hypothetical protein
LRAGERGANVRLKYVMADSAPPLYAHQYMTAGMSTAWPRALSTLGAESWPLMPKAALRWKNPGALMMGELGGGGACACVVSVRVW